MVDRAAPLVLGDFAQLAAVLLRGVDRVDHPLQERLIAHLEQHESAGLLLLGPIGWESQSQDHRVAQELVAQLGQVGPKDSLDHGARLLEPLVLFRVEPGLHRRQPPQVRCEPRLAKREGLVAQALDGHDHGHVGRHHSQQGIGRSRPGFVRHGLTRGEPKRQPESGPQGRGGFEFHQAPFAAAGTGLASGLALTSGGPSKNPKASRAVDDRGPTLEARPSPTWRNSADAAVESGAAGT